MKFIGKQRLNYYKDQDMFIIELFMEGKWEFSIGYKCVDYEGNKNFIHYEILKQINRNICLGFELICNYEF